MASSLPPSASSTRSVWGEDGKPELVIDWKSDVHPSAAASDHYRSQVRCYLEVTGILKGMVVFVTTGAVLHVSTSVCAT